MILDRKIVKPLITEKGLKIEENDKYIFDVALGATKNSIITELKRIFNVDVIDVHTMILPGKKRRILKTYRFKTTPKRKKAIVTLKKGQKLDLFKKESK